MIEATGTATGIQIMVVDDEPAIVALLAEVLTEAGYTVRCCGRGDEALALAHAAPPDLILLDIRMPGPGGTNALDGLRVADWLARDPRTCGIPLLLITGVGPREQGQWKGLLSDRGQRVLFKPFRLMELLDTIKQILSERS